jgi:ATP-dependent DNA helicase RecG
MEKTADGFQIAEEDLALRGPGEFFGVRQSGLPDFRVAHIIRDAPILIEARKEAFRLIEEDPELVHPSHTRLKDMLMKRWRGRLELASIG